MCRFTVTSCITTFPLSTWLNSWDTRSKPTVWDWRTKVWDGNFCQYIDFLFFCFCFFEIDSLLTIAFKRAIFVDQLLSQIWLFPTPWTAAHQASLSFTISQSFLKLVFIEWVMPSNHVILCHPLLLPAIFPSIRVFSIESALCITWPKRAIHL